MTKQVNFNIVEKSQNTIEIQTSMSVDLKDRCQLIPNEIDKEDFKDVVSCFNPIKIKPLVLELTKDYIKAAIRTHPNDLLQWSHDYFNSLQTGELLNVADRLELKTPSPNNVTISTLRKIHTQLKWRDTVKYNAIEMLWTEFDLLIDELNTIWEIGGFSKTNAVSYTQFLALTLDKLSNNLRMTMQRICEFLTLDPPHGPAAIPFTTFRDLYKFIVSKKKYEISERRVSEFLGYIFSIAEKQEDQTTPNDFFSIKCPIMNQPSVKVENHGSLDETSITCTECLDDDNLTVKESLDEMEAMEEVEGEECGSEFAIPTYSSQSSTLSYSSSSFMWK